MLDLMLALAIVLVILHVSEKTNRISYALK